ncbi:hypothetical protein AVEN_137163-1 [Araneus ventricosus]|uniref:Secreted protein n=1 Tax=Araneus ventricosus TaxID=182803 RepID=A0A4Y2QK99_ARAVE|nr:hypothetical protein AVEN_238330-1 [Araneus ventricosus]GBN63754.1 hypothetical protein AVEN_66102-1 [Araneus ventricosus]GBN63935.1 hypothetical protein AVEN_170008-1 [Araneus ventricosus]GBN66959.1 hypothetical protein AVEN_137163-1 [Araneus ventricosus]
MRHLLLSVLLFECKPCFRPSWCDTEVWRGVPAQVSSSGSGSKLRGPSQNIPRVGTKRDVNIRTGGNVRCRDRRIEGAKPDSTKNPPSMPTLCMTNSSQDNVPSLVW